MEDLNKWGMCKQSHLV